MVEELTRGANGTGPTEGLQPSLDPVSAAIVQLSFGYPGNIDECRIAELGAVDLDRLEYRVDGRDRAGTIGQLSRP